MGRIRSCVLNMRFSDSRLLYSRYGNDLLDYSLFDEVIEGVGRGRGNGS